MCSAASPQTPCQQAPQPGLAEALGNALGSAFAAVGLPHDLGQIKPADRPDLADYQCNGAMAGAKLAQQNPRALAEQVLQHIPNPEHFGTFTIAGPGFINIQLHTDALYRATCAALLPDFCQPNVGNGLKVNVEFVSINPTGPIHVGHGRNAVFGDALSTLLARTHHAVFREYLINDAGNQIRTLVLSVHARYCALFGDPLHLPEDGYVGDYIIDIAEALRAQDGERWRSITDEPLLLANLREFCVTACMNMIRQDLATLNIHFDYFHSEYAMHQAGNPLAQAIAQLRAMGKVYEGTLPPPKGKPTQTYDPAPLTLFKATDYGAEQDKPIYNRSGQATYFGQDIAYGAHKLARGFDQLAVVVGVEQTGNFTPLTWALAALTGREDVLCPIYYGMVKVERDGTPVKLSKRAGNIVALGDVLAEVGADAYRFHMLNRKPETPLVFDLAAAVAQSMENPVYYVQYAHARCCRLLETAASAGLPLAPSPTPATKPTPWQDAPTPLARAVIRTVLDYPNVLARAATAKEPHRLTFYTQELAAAFHTWYGDAKLIDPTAPDRSQQNILIIQAAQTILRDALGILGVSAPQQM